MRCRCVSTYTRFREFQDRCELVASFALGSRSGLVECRIKIARDYVTREFSALNRRGLLDVREPPRSSPIVIFVWHRSPSRSALLVRESPRVTFVIVLLVRI